jgi:hypothetical protein
LGWGKIRFHKIKFRALLKTTAIMKLRVFFFDLLLAAFVLIQPFSRGATADAASYVDRSRLVVDIGEECAISVRDFFKGAPARSELQCFPRFAWA